MRIAANGITRYQLVLGVIFATASAIFLMVVYQLGIDSEVVTVYFPYADELMHGSIPEMEYPPFALVFIAIPRLFAASTLGYEIAFVAEVFVFFMIGLVVTGKLAKRFCQSQHTAMLAYTVLMLLLLEFVLDRYDIFPAILTLLSFYCLVTKRYMWAFMLLSVASMTKLYPAVLFPIYLIPLFFNRDWMNILKGAGVFIATALLILLPFLLFGSDTVFHFLSYHLDRPLQVESMFSSFIAFASLLGLTNIWVEFGFGSDNLMGAWPDAVAQYLTPLMLSVLVAVYILYIYLIKRLRDDKQDNENNRMVLLGGAVLLALFAFIIFGKVFSSQYLIWIVPFIVFMMTTSIDHRFKNYIFVLSVILIALTQLGFAVNVGIDGGAVGMSEAGMMIFLAKNVVAILLFTYIIRTLIESVKKRPWRASPPENPPDI